MWTYQPEWFGFISISQNEALWATRLRLGNPGHEIKKKTYIFLSTHWLFYIIYQMILWSQNLLKDIFYILVIDFYPSYFSLYGYYSGFASNFYSGFVSSENGDYGSPQLQIFLVCLIRLPCSATCVNNFVSQVTRSFSLLILPSVCHVIHEFSKPFIYSLSPQFQLSSYWFSFAVFYPLESNSSFILSSIPIYNQSFRST